MIAGADVDAAGILVLGAADGQAEDVAVELEFSGFYAGGIEDLDGFVAGDEDLSVGGGRQRARLVKGQGYLAGLPVTYQGGVDFFRRLIDPLAAVRVHAQNGYRRDNDCQDNRTCDRHVSGVKGFCGHVSSNERRD